MRSNVQQWWMADDAHYLNIYDMVTVSDDEVAVGDLLHVIGPCATREAAQRQAKEYLDGVGNIDRASDSVGV